MTREEYLKDAFEKFNRDVISPEAYDSIIANQDIFCEEGEYDECEDELAERED